MTIYLGADHRGFRLKEHLKKYLSKKKIIVQDLGATRLLLKDDYPKYGLAVGRAVAKNAHDFGIVVCGSGIGITLAANKIRGVRAGLASSAAQASQGRREDHMNILGIAADFTSQATAERMTSAFLTAIPGRSARYRRRTRQTNQYGNKG